MKKKIKQAVPLASVVRHNGDPDISQRLDACVAAGGPFHSGKFCSNCKYRQDMHTSRVAKRDAALIRVELAETT